MLWPAGFAVLLLLVVAAKYLWPQRERCPQCMTPRDPESPLCAECGWIYESPDESDDDYGEPEEELSD